MGSDEMRSCDLETNITLKCLELDLNTPVAYRAKFNNFDPTYKVGYVGVS